MQIKNIIEPRKFFEAVAKCNGSVELLTKEGDRLNMKSTLCQYIALTQMFEDENMSGVEIKVSDESDWEKLCAFLITE
ncbi:MAG: polya polymerase [Clostridia bacterium]|nr:polya polymerase [Clostridia bacterium]